MPKNVCLTANGTTVKNSEAIKQPMIQDEIFRLYEGDNYLKRRKQSLRSDKDRIKDDLPLTLIQRNQITFHSVAEVGAYNGFRLAELIKNYGCTAVAFEPALLSIADGKRKFPDITFHRNTAAQLEADDECFDLVIIDFVFHWIDRRMLLRSVAEIDRILKPDGWLVVGDMWTDHPSRTRYHHIQDKDVWTYKQNYCDIFLSTNCYRQLDAIERPSSQIDPVPRCCALLQKTLSGRYPVEGRSK